MREGGVAEPKARPTEQWSHGNLVRVSDQARLDALIETWGKARCQGAIIGAFEPEWTDDRVRIQPSLDGMNRLIERAFRHVACKVNWTAARDLGHLTPHRALIEAIHTTRFAHPDSAIQQLLNAFESPMALFAAMDDLDRALDEGTGTRPWLLSKIPEHCARLWPLRNIIRLADARGVLLRPMRFTDYEAEDSFVPELPAVCVDTEIYGGGFDHDLFHHLFRTAATEDADDFEVGMLLLEAAAQAYNSLVLASRHSGPTYEGHATWPGASLFGTLECQWGLSTVPQQVFAYGLLGAALHPRFEGDAVSALLERLPTSASSDSVMRLVNTNRRYVSADANWLAVLRPRYEAPVMHALRTALHDRFYADLEALIADLDEVLWTLEDIDLRQRDHPLVGKAASRRQRGRRLWLKALELNHLVARAPQAALRDSVGMLCEDLQELDDAQRRHVASCRALLYDPRARDDAALMDRLKASDEGYEDAVANWTEQLDAQVRTIRRLQANDSLEGPKVASDHAHHHAELFRGVEFEMPVHVGSDGPEAPR